MLIQLKKQQKIKIFSLLAISAALFAGCAGKNPEEIYNSKSAEQIYTEGVAKAKKSHFGEAVKDFEALEARYPFGDYAEKSQLAEMYSYYRQQDYPNALASAEHFIRLHPRHPHVDYVYYLKGLVHFSESLGDISKYLPMERSERDTESAKEAYAEFLTLINQFPESRYVDDAKQRVVYLRNTIANNELHAARFYMRRGAFLAAATRTNYIIEHFDQSPAIEDALGIQAQAYERLELHDLAEVTLSVLKHNFPNSYYLKQMG